MLGEVNLNCSGFQCVNAISLCLASLGNLNQYKIPFAVTYSQVFSETAWPIITCDIPVDSAWSVGGHWLIHWSIKWLCPWLLGQEPAAVFYRRNLSLASIWQIIWMIVKKSFGSQKWHFYILSSKFVWRVGFRICGSQFARSAGFFMKTLFCLKRGNDQGERNFTKNLNWCLLASFHPWQDRG